MYWLHMYVCKKALRPNNFLLVYCSILILPATTAMNSSIAFFHGGFHFISYNLLIPQIVLHAQYQLLTESSDTYAKQNTWV